METSDERRKRKLKWLCASEGRSIESVAEVADVSPEAIDQIIKGTLLPKKKDGTQSARNLGDPVARKIELALNLGRGWFDADDLAWPFPKIERKRFEDLEPDQRIEIQGVVRDRIESFETAHSTNAKKAA